MNHSDYFTSEIRSACWMALNAGDAAGRTPEQRLADAFGAITLPRGDWWDALPDEVRAKWYELPTSVRVTLYVCVEPLAREISSLHGEARQREERA